MIAIAEVAAMQPAKDEQPKSTMADLGNSI